MIKLGSKVRDKITGFTGITTGHARYLYGCDQYNIIPAIDKDGKIPDGQWFDEGRIEVVEEEVIKPESVQVKKPGGPNRDAPNI